MQEEVTNFKLNKYVLPAMISSYFCQMWSGSVQNWCRSAR